MAKSKWVIRKERVFYYSIYRQSSRSIVNAKTFSTQSAAEKYIKRHNLGDEWYAWEWVKKRKRK